MAKKKQPTSLSGKWLEFVFEPKRFCAIVITFAVLLICIKAANDPHRVAVWGQNILLSAFLAVQPVLGFLLVIGIMYVGIKLMFRR